MPDIDHFLPQGGIALGELTEISGNPGSGRTRLTLELVSQVLLSDSGKGFNSCIYVDSRNAVDPKWLCSLLYSKLNVTNTKRPRFSSEIERAGFNNSSRFSYAKQMLQNLILYSVTSFSSLIAFVNLLPHLLKCHSKVRLVVFNTFILESCLTSLRQLRVYSAGTKSDREHEIEMKDTEFLLGSASMLTPLEYGIALRNICITLRNQAYNSNVAIVLLTTLRQREFIFMPIVEPWTMLLQKRYLIRTTEIKHRHALTKIDPIVDSIFFDNNNSLDDAQSVDFVFPPIDVMQIG